MTDFDLEEIYSDRADLLSAIAHYERLSANATRSLKDLRLLLLKLDEEIRAIRP